MNDTMIHNSINNNHESSVLLEALSLDFAAAFLAASVASPLVYIIDDSVIRRAVASVPLVTGLREGAVVALKSPVKFVRSGSFGLVFLVFSGTYLTANWAETLGKHYTKTMGRKSAAVEAGPPTKVPMIAYGFFLGRDLASMATAFNCPEYVSASLQGSTNWSVNQCDIVSQFTVPVLGQLFISPFHLAGVQAVNLGQGKPMKFGKTMSFIQQNFIGTTILRMFRVLPAFGFGGVTNNLVRAKNRQRQQF